MSDASLTDKQIQAIIDGNQKAIDGEFVVGIAPNAVPVLAHQYWIKIPKTICANDNKSGVTRKKDLDWDNPLLPFKPKMSIDDFKRFYKANWRNEPLINKEIAIKFVMLTLNWVGEDFELVDEPDPTLTNEQKVGMRKVKDFIDYSVCGSILSAAAAQYNLTNHPTGADDVIPPGPLLSVLKLNSWWSDSRADQKAITEMMFRAVCPLNIRLVFAFFGYSDVAAEFLTLLGKPRIPQIDEAMFRGPSAGTHRITTTYAGLQRLCAINVSNLLMHYDQQARLRELNDEVKVKGAKAHRSARWIYEISVNKGIIDASQLGFNQQTSEINDIVNKVALAIKYLARGSSIAKSQLLAAEAARNPDQSFIDQLKMIQAYREKGVLDAVDSFSIARPMGKSMNSPWSEAVRLADTQHHDFLAKIWNAQNRFNSDGVAPVPLISNTESVDASAWAAIRDAAPSVTTDMQQPQQHPFFSHGNAPGGPSNQRPGGNSGFGGNGSRRPGGDNIFESQSKRARPGEPESVEEEKSRNRNR